VAACNNPSSGIEIEYFLGQLWKYEYVKMTVLRGITVHINISFHKIPLIS
jgi:hypothetical protein